ncbi:MAG: sulfurtransferase complex subunit TusB [Colwellia sp.]|nr:sulfurtransferase complex subunit TusB [Colwellia sp.]MCW9080704.1 sulfurtransferase complex subunit TusB [Colwellia sp.]
MTTLHIVRQSAYATNDFEQCIQVLNDTDLIVFTDDGCYNLTHNCQKRINEQVKQMLIADHAKARAIEFKETKVTAITMDDLVTLTFQADRVITWQ